MRDSAHVAMLKFLVAARKRRLAWTRSEEIVQLSPVNPDRLNTLARLGHLYGELRTTGPYKRPRWYVDPKEVVVWGTLGRDEKQAILSNKTTLRQLMDLPDLSAWEDRGNIEPASDRDYYPVRGRLTISVD